MTDKSNTGPVKAVVDSDGDNVVKGGVMGPAPSASYIESTPPAEPTPPAEESAQEPPQSPPNE